MRNPLRKWSLVLGLVAVAAGLSSVAASARGVATKVSPREKSRALLALVQRWGCQYQNIEPDRIAASFLDLIVVDPVIDGVSGQTAAPDVVRSMQSKPDGSRRLVFAYLSVGAAEEYRAYWNAEWLEAPPAWLGPLNPDWPRSRSVRYWQPEWQGIVIEGLRKIVAAGFDGVFLDRVDAYGDWRDEQESAQADMSAFVAKLAKSARTKRPDFLVIGQNAEHLLPSKIYRNALDGVSKESLLTGLQGQGVPNRPDQIEWSMTYLVPAKHAGLRMFAIEYLPAHAEVEPIRAQLVTSGFVPFFGQRLLDRLP
jgi:cysteinyl-tRNA synthetase, unknown class